MKYRRRVIALTFSVIATLVGGRALLDYHREALPDPSSGSSPSVRIVADPSPAPVARDNNQEWDEMFLATIDQLQADGGLEVGSAGFHSFPGDALTELLTYGVEVRRNEDGSLPTVPYRVAVRVERDEILQLGVKETQLYPSATEPGMHDVQARFVESVKPYAEARQAARDFAYQNGLPFDDQGVALVHDNKIVGAFTYGTLYAAAKQGQWLTVAFALDQTDAMALASLLNQ